MVLRCGYDVVDFVGVLRFFLLEYLLGLVAHAPEGLVVLVGDEIARVPRHRSNVPRDDFVQIFELRALYPETST